jgi:hypothetical protein
LKHVFSFPEIDRIIVGVDSIDQLNEIIISDKGGLTAPEHLICDDVDLIDPTKWAKT